MGFPGAGFHLRHGIGGPGDCRQLEQLGPVDHADQALAVALDHLGPVALRHAEPRRQPTDQPGRMSRQKVLRPGRARLNPRLEDQRVVGVGQVQAASSSAGERLLEVMPGQQVNVLARLDPGCECPRRKHLALAGRGRRQNRCRPIGEAAPQAGRPALGAQLKRTVEAAPQHQGAPMPVRMRVCVPRGTVKSAVTSPVSTIWPDCALV